MSQHSHLLASHDRRAKFVDIEAGMVSAGQNPEEIENHKHHEVIVEVKLRPAVKKTPLKEIQTLNQHRNQLIADDGRDFVDIEAGLHMKRHKGTKNCNIREVRAKSPVGKIPLQKAQMPRSPWSTQKPQNNCVESLRKQLKKPVPTEVKKAPKRVYPAIYDIESEIPVRAKIAKLNTSLQKETYKKEEIQRSIKNLKQIRSWIIRGIKTEKAFLIFQLFVTAFIFFIIVNIANSVELKWKAAQIASVIVILLFFIGSYLYNLLLKKRVMIVHEHLA